MTFFLRSLTIALLFSITVYNGFAQCFICLSNVEDFDFDIGVGYAYKAWNIDVPAGTTTTKRMATFLPYVQGDLSFPHAQISYRYSWKGDSIIYKYDDSRQLSLSGYRSHELRLNIHPIDLDYSIRPYVGCGLGWEMADYRKDLQGEEMEMRRVITGLLGGGVEIHLGDLVKLVTSANYSYYFRDNAIDGYQGIEKKAHDSAFTLGLGLSLTF